MRKQGVKIFVDFCVCSLVLLLNLAFRATYVFLNPTLVLNNIQIEEGQLLGKCFVFSTKK